MTISNNTAELQELDRRHHLHPFMDQGDLNRTGARVITRAEGIYIYDSDGKRLLDGMSGLWCVDVGYGRTELAEAAYKQMLELPYYNTFFRTTHVPAIRLAEKLAEIAPKGFSHVFFAGSGSEANDTNVKLARYYWAVKGQPDKHLIVARDKAYHGSTIAATSLCGLSGMHERMGLPLKDFVERIPAPYWYAQGGDLSPDEFGLQTARALERKILEVGADKIAAFIGEPIQGAGGLIVPPDSYWPEIQRICRQYDILLISDEVITGFGRTGNWWGCQTFGFEPDLITMAKGLSSGYLPIAGVLVGDRVAETVINAGHEFAHGYTYSAHPVSAAVALKNIEILQGEGLVARVGRDIGPYFQEQIRSLADHPLVGEVRGHGLIAGIELVADKAARRFFDPALDVGTICRNHCFANGLVMRAVRDTMMLAPPYIITRDQVNELVGLARRCFDLTLADVGGR